MKAPGDNRPDVTNLRPCDHQAFFEALDSRLHRPRRCVPLFAGGMTSLLIFTISSKPTTDSPHLFPSIHFDISPLSRKHSSGTAQRLLRESFSANATCLEVGNRSLSDMPIPGTGV